MTELGIIAALAMAATYFAILVRLWRLIIHADFRALARITRWFTDMAGFE